MNTFTSFLRDIFKEIKYSEAAELSKDNIKHVISKINQYFYTNYDGIGYTNIMDEDFEYFSEFHKFWEKYHKEILNPIIDGVQCEKLAEILHDLYMKHGKSLYYELYDTHSLTAQDICKVRYFSANQDFRGSRDFGELVQIYSDDPSIFNTDNIFSNPANFLRDIGITSLSQSDKRVKYATTAAKILIDNKIEPFELLKHAINDVSVLKQLLVGTRGSGFGNKKADMFLRDMIVLGVWKDYTNFDKIDVASDINTIKVALRSRILVTEIPLISSFLDIFGYQYSTIDEMSALAWRKVWIIWQEKYPKECIESPCLIDNLIYRIIGKEFCKESLCFYSCEKEKHIFKWHSSRNRTCQICAKKGIRNRANIINRVLPCTDVDGVISIKSSDYVSGKDAILPGITECPLIPVCTPKLPVFKKLNPPKSISILGQTGWDSARTRADEGGGGLMA